MENKIKELENEIALLKGRLEFQQKQEELKISTLQADIKDELRMSIMLEVEGIHDICERLDEKYATKIERRLARIEKRLGRL